MDNLASLLESGSTSRACERASLPENGTLQPDNWLSTAIEEYKSIRTESLGSMTVQNTIVGYGVAATAALLTAAIGFIDKNDSTILDLAIFCLFIPSVVSFIIMIWAGEVARMYRAGSFLAMREKVINKHIDAKGGPLSESLGWENWLFSEDANNKNQTPHHRLYAQHYYILAMFIFLGLLSMFIGNYKGYTASPVMFFIFDILVVSGLATLAVLALSILRHFQPQIAPWILLIDRRAPFGWLWRRTG